MKKEWRAAGCLGGAILLAIGAALTFFMGVASAAQWLLQAALLWALVCWMTRQRLDLNRATPAAPLYPQLGLANRLTLLRGGLIAATGGFLGQPQAFQIPSLQPELTILLSWLPGLLYMAAAILDRVDGFIARRTRHTSLLGSELDTLLDALGLLVAPLLAVAYGKVHWSFLLVSVAYYCFQWGIGWRARRALPVYPLLPSPLRRTLAGFQMGFVAMVLLPPFQPPLTTLLGWSFMVPILLGFVVDWCVVSGRIDGQKPGTARFFAQFAGISYSVIQPFMRLMLIVMLVVFASIHPMPILVLIGLPIFGLLVLLGAAARVGALGLLVVLGWNHGALPLDVLIVIAALCAVGVLLLGSGRWSCWAWDDAWVNRQDGA